MEKAFDKIQHPFWGFGGQEYMRNPWTFHAILL
jgi:hypothetical protein